MAINAKIDLKKPVLEEISAQVEGAQCVLLVNYSGLTVAQDTQLRKELREAGVHYKVYKNTEIRKIRKELKNSVSALGGQTGAGKSTLLNKIDKNLNLKTGEVSEALGRGKHTTRLVTLIPTCKGLIADTPGFSSLELNYKWNEISDGFKEFGYNCKYKTCNHTNVNGCDVIKRVNAGKILKSRYDSYVKLIKEENHGSKW